MRVLFLLFLLPLWRASAPRRSSRVLVADMDCVGGSQKPHSIVLVGWILPRNVASKASSCLVQRLDLTRLAPVLLVNLSLLSCDSGALLRGTVFLILLTFSRCISARAAKCILTSHCPKTVFGNVRRVDLK